MLGKDQYRRRLWEYSPVRNRKQGQWQRESPAKENLEKVKCRKDTDIVLQDDETGGDWEEYKSIFRVQAKATEWAL